VGGGRARRAARRTGGRAALGLACVGTLLGAGAGAVTGAGAAVARVSPRTAPTEYYVALGDSLAAGVGATTVAKGYVGDLYAHEHKTHRGLVLENLSCSGATTSSMINGPGCSYTTGSQLGDAEAFLQAHPGQVAFVSIDIGANDVDGCVSGSGVNTTCFNEGMSAITANLPVILSGLESAGDGVPVVGMSYYDPFLAAWLLGSSGESLAQQSETLAVQLNTQLEKDYGSALTADVAGAFDTTDFTLIRYEHQKVPVNVVRICQWTHMCASEDIHADNVGHAQIARVFQAIVTPVLNAGRGHRGAAGSGGRRP
jgi:lysophospholipase L1-like esterase